MGSRVSTLSSQVRAKAKDKAKAKAKARSLDFFLINKLGLLASTSTEVQNRAIAVAPFILCSVAPLM